MKLHVFILACLAPAAAWAQSPPADDAEDAPDAPAPEPTPEPTPATEPAPPPTPPPAPAPTPPPAPAPAPAAVPAEPKHDDKPFVDDYYDRKRGLGMFHQARLAIGVLQGTAPNFMDDTAPMTPGETKDVTQGELAFEGVYLGLPSSYGHFHGIEFSTGIRSTPIDYWLQFGTAVSLFNLGHGGPGSLRVGGSFGAGFDLAHAYGYVRGRAAIVLIPARVDGEVSAQWMPSNAGTGNYDEVLYRGSLWYRPGGPGGSKRAYEAYVEAFHRTDDAADKKREFVGIGGGIGMTLF